jgi:hypothetical protein
LSRQLEIIVNGRDNASSAFKQVGASAKGLKGDLGGVGEAAHGLRKGLREVHHAMLLVEAVPLLVNAAGAAFDALGGFFEGGASGALKAAEAQKQFNEALKEIPIIGGALSKMGQGAGDFFAKHVWGTQTSSEILAEAEAQKKAVEGRRKILDKLPEATHKAEFDASLVGLSPSDKAIAQAQEKWREADEKIRAQRKALNTGEAAGMNDVALAQVGVEKAGTDEEKAAAQKNLADVMSRTEEARIRQSDQLARQEVAIAKERDGQIAEANAKRLVDEITFTERLADAERARAARIAELQGQVNVNTLQLADRGYEARLAGLKAAHEREQQAIDDNAHKQVVAVEKEAAELRARAKGGDQQAALRLARIEEDEPIKIQNAREAQHKLTDEQYQGAMALEKQNELREAQSAGMRALADLGDVNAKHDLDVLETTRQRKQLTDALVAAGENDKAKKLSAAFAEADRLKAENETRSTAQKLIDAGTFALREQAEMGSVAAQRELKRLEIQQKFNAERLKLGAILKDEQTSEAQKDAARKAMAGLGATENAALAMLGRAAQGEGQLADLHESGRLTGVAARAAQPREQFAPILEAMGAGKQVLEDLKSLIATYLPNLAPAAGAPVKLWK